MNILYTRTSSLCRVTLGCTHLSVDWARDNQDYLDYLKDRTCYIIRGSTKIIKDQRTEEVKKRRNEENKKGGTGKVRNKERKCEYWSRQTKNWIWKEQGNERTKKPKEATRKGSNNKKDEETNNYLNLPVYMVMVLHPNWQNDFFSHFFCVVWLQFWCGLIFF